jgi:glutamyl-tRNA synthetase/nondiscriminating glutamyl-tRNA synthetase
MSKIRVRYAPSPTGFLHIGNARTALFNYLFACHYKGDLILRIEDTDLSRNIESSEKNQLENLKWLGINWSEGPDCGGKFGPYRQSERLNIYQKYANILLKKKIAYKEYKNDNSNNSKNNFVIRFKVPYGQKYEFNDLVRGRLLFESKEIEDWIIIKRNGFPTYNFAVVIDDYLMGITHILRGEEHITNTPKQIMVFNSFNWKIPFFAHISLILNKNKKKLSKRDSDVLQFIEKYIDLGFLPEALFNFLSLLGFSPKKEQTIFRPNELIEIFDEKRLSKAPAIFDEKKLFFINNHYIKKMPLEELKKKIDFFLKKEKIFLNDSFLSKFVFLFKDRINYIQEIVHIYNYFFLQKTDLRESDIKFIKENKSFDLIKILYNAIFCLENFSLEEIKKTIFFLSQQTQLKGKEFFLTIRIACTSKIEGPHLPNYLELLGKKKILKNIKKILLKEEKIK